MPNVNGSAGGSSLVIPGIYSIFNVSGTSPQIQPTTPPLVFIGYGSGTKPQSLNYFTTAQGLTTALRGGSCSSFVPFLTNPSPVLNGATSITYINVGENTQASFSLTSGVVSGVVDLTTADYGAPSNLMQVEVQSGTIGGVNLTLYDGYLNSGMTGYNLGLPFQLSYTNSTNPGTVTYSVNYTNSVPSSFEINSTVSGESMTIPIGNSGYTTISALVQYINGSGLPFFAQVISNGSLPTLYLDEASSISLPAPSGGTDQFVNVTATLGDIVYWVNQYANILCTATSPYITLVNGVVTANTSTTGDAPSVISLTHFTGGTSVPPQTSDYADAFNLALTTPAWAIFVDSNSSAIMSLAAQHVETASSIVERKWRRYVTGSSVGDPLTTTQKNAQGLNSIWVTYCAPGLTAIDTNTGLNTTYAGLYFGAEVVGMFCGNPIGTPITNKALNATGLEVSYTTSQINQLQQAGVCVARINQTTNIPVIASDLTTWQNDNNPSNVFNQQIACRAALSYGLAAVLDTYVGQINGGPVSLATVQTAIQNFLGSIQYTGQGSSGYVVNYSNIALTFDNATQTLSVTLNVTFIQQFRFIVCTVAVQAL